MFSTVWLAVIFTLAGAAVGSFLNVCIGRIPEGLSIVTPPSRCPQCGHPIRFYDNIPVISFLLLGGKCRDCRGRISFRYPLIELLTALFAWLLFRRFGLTPAFPAVFVFICTLIVISFIDLDHQIIPHRLTLSGIPVFAVLAVLFMGLTAIDAFLGIMIGAGILYFVAVYYEALTGRGGDGRRGCQPARHAGGVSRLEVASLRPPRQLAFRGRRRACVHPVQGQGHEVCGPVRPFSLYGGRGLSLFGGDLIALFLSPRI